MRDVSKAAGGILAREGLRRAALTSTSLLALAAVFSMSSAAVAQPWDAKAASDLRLSPAWSGLDAVDDLTAIASASTAKNRDFTAVDIRSLTAGEPAITTHPVIDLPSCNGMPSCNANNTKNYTTTLLGTAYDGPVVNANASADLNFTNSGNIVASGDGFVGVAGSVVTATSTGAFTSNAATTLTNSGTITSSGIGLYAYSHATAFGGDPYVKVTAMAMSAIINSGVVTTTGTHAAGISASAMVNATAPNIGAYARAIAANAIKNSAAISTSGAYSSGILATSNAFATLGSGNEATATTYVNNSGAISTSGDFSGGILAISTVSATGGPEQNVGATAFATTSINNNGSITTSGAGASGISTGATAIATVPVINSYATAVAINTVANSAAISTSGASSDGISAYSSATASGYYASTTAKTSVVNSSAITTSGDVSDGILALSSAYAKGAYGIFGTATTYVKNSAAITTSGGGANGVDAYSSAFASGTSGSATAATMIMNSGTIATSGDYSYGILAASFARAQGSTFSIGANASTSLTNGGVIRTSGVGAFGLVASSYANAFVAPASDNATANAVTTATNSGVIKTSGLGAVGIYTRSTAVAIGYSASANATTNVTNTAAITTSGNYAHGIVAHALAYAYSFTSFGNNLSKATAATTVTNSGNITVTGTHSAGILAGASALAFSGGAAYAGYTPTATVSTATVNNSGKIIASGFNSAGIVVSGNATVNNSGTVTGGSGPYAAGIYAFGNSIAITNSGKLQAYGRHAVNIPYAYNATLTNSGTMIGYVTLHGTSVNVMNAGTWAAGGGASDFTPVSVSTLTNTGKIVVFGSQTFAGLSKFDNMGLLSLAQADSAPFAGVGPAGLGTRPALETLTVSGDFVGGQGSKLAVDCSTSQCDTLKIGGTVSGSTEVVVNSTFGPPGLTSGNGIPVVTASTVTSPGNFTGSFVDGAYEYNLDFVPGSGSSASWDLQSRVFPGVYQFGQIGSSELMTAQLANGFLLDFFPRAEQAADQSGLALRQQPVRLASNDPGFIPGAPAIPTDLAGWGGGNYDNMTIRPHGSLASDYRFRGQAAQIGVDDTWQNILGTVVLGFYAAPVRANSDFYHFNTAHIITEGVAYGAYGIWLQGPMEAGLRFSYDALNTNFVDYYLGSSAKTNNQAWNMDAAISYNLPLQYDIHLQPRAEFNYTRAGGTSFNDGASGAVNEVDVSGTNGFQGLIQGRLSKSYVVDTTLVTPHIDAGVLYQGGSDTGVTLGSFHTSTNIRGVSGTVGGGLDLGLSRNASAFFDGGYLPGDHIQGWRASAGLRWSLSEPK